MEIFFIVFLIIIIVEILFFLLLLSTIEIEIKDCDFSHVDKTIDKFKIVKMKIFIKIKLLRKILLFSFVADEKYIDILKFKIQHNYSDKLESNLFTIIKKAKFLIEKYGGYTSRILKLKVRKIDIFSAIGMSNDMYTIFLLPLLSTYLAFKMRDIIAKYNVEEYTYEIIPRYIKQVYFKIVLNLIIEIKVVDLLRFMIYIKRIKK